MSDATEGAERGTLDRMFDHPPGWILHVLLGLALLVYLAASSAPGSLFRASVGATLVVLVLVLTWVARVAGYLVARRAGRAEGSPWWLAVAPLLIVVTLLLVATDVPLRLRFAQAKGDFEDRVEQIDAGETEGERAVDLGGSYGTYDISRVGQTADGNAIVFFTSKGGLFQDVGFAYIPDDPDEADLELVGDPQLTSLGGDWYAFTAER
jgi:hypothetical protein